jgi:hypothetical protein
MDRRKQTLGKKSLGNGDEKEIEKKKKGKNDKKEMSIDWLSRTVVHVRESRRRWPRRRDMELVLRLRGACDEGQATDENQSRG